MYYFMNQKCTIYYSIRQKCDIIVYTMKRKNCKFFLLFIFAPLVLSSCFSPWKGNETALTLLFGNSSGGRAAIPEGVVHTIELDGPTGRQSHTVETTTFSVTIMPGHWYITVRASLDGRLYAKGESGADIIAGKNNTVEIKMEVQLYTVTFDGNGNTGGTPPAPITQEYSGKAIILPDSNNMSKVHDGNSSYVFVCWNTNKDGTGENYDVKASYTPTADSILYAKWELYP
jgi:hypothetical protein